MAEPKVHWKKIVSDPNFIGEGDFEPGEEKILTIASVNKSETIVTAEGKSKKAVIHWVEQNNKPMILNVARSKAIEKVNGSGWLDDWPGTKVQLYIEHGIKAFGEVVSAVRVRPFKPKVTTLKCEACYKPITPASNLSVEQLSSYTKRKYGKSLCAACASKAANSQDKPKAEEAPRPDETAVEQNDSDA